MVVKEKIMGEFGRVNEEEKDFINKELARFEKTFGEIFNEMMVKIDCHEEKKTSRGRKEYTCRINVSTDKGSFHADSAGFGAEKTIVTALNKVEKQIRK